METTETPTPVPSETPTPTATYTPTANYYVEMTAEPSGVPVRVAREVSVADYWMILLLTAILLSMWLMYGANRLRGGR